MMKFTKIIWLLPRWKQILLAIFVVSMALKVYQFTEFPIGYHPDEQIYVVNAFSLWKTGTDLSGEWQWWKIVPFHTMFAELPSVINSIGFLFSEDPYVAGRIASLFFGSTLPLLIFFVAKKISNNLAVSLFVYFVASFNPWLWQQSRMAFDALYTLWFYFLGISLLFTKNRWLRLLSIPVLFIGFFQYQGLKLIFPLLIFSTLLYQYISPKSTRKDKHLLLVISGIIVVFLGWYTLVKLPAQSASVRMQRDTIFSQNYRAQIGQKVNDERRISLRSEAAPMFSNKLSVFLYEINKKALEAVDLKTLFLTNEPAISDFSVWSHGSFYLLDFFLILLGIGYGFVRFPKQSLFLLVLFVFGLVPAIISNSNTWFTFRMSFSYFVLFFFIAFGLHNLWERNRRFFWTIFGLYVGSILVFSYHFFVRYPLYSANGFRFQYRVLSEYSMRNADKSVYVATNEPAGFVRYYLLESSPSTSQLTQLQTPDFYEKDTFQIDNLTVSSRCLRPEMFQQQTYSVVAVDQGMSFCDPSELKNDAVEFPAFHLSISSVLDSGEQIKIYNDSLCLPYSNTAHMDISNLAETKLAQLDTRRFCELWIKNTNILK